MTGVAVRAVRGARLRRLRDAALSWVGRVEIALEELADAPQLYTGAACPTGASHHWLPFSAGWGCAACPAWVPGPRLGETVEQHPAGSMDLRAAASAIVKALTGPSPVNPAQVTQPMPIPTTVVPALTAAYEDRLMAIVNTMLPIVRDDVKDIDLLHVAQRVERIGPAE